MTIGTHPLTVEGYREEGPLPICAQSRLPRTAQVRSASGRGTRGPRPKEGGQRWLAVEGYFQTGNNH